jgi:hypothetical protein
MLKNKPKEKTFNFSLQENEYLYVSEFEDAKYKVGS